MKSVTSNVGLCLIALVALSPGISTAADEDNTTVTIVTAEEYEKALSPFENVEEALSAERERSVSDPNGPSILIESPQPGDEPLQAPVAVEIDWEAKDGAAVDLDSFRVLYKLGFFTKDVTGRILDAMGTVDGSRFDASGLYVPAAYLPAGRHRLIIELADTIKRRSYKDLVFEVTDT